MAYIHIYVGNGSNICVKNNQLKIVSDVNQETFPLEDVDTVMIENLQTNVSTYTLSKLAESGVLTFICNEKHIPNAYLLPFSSHFNQLKIHSLQTRLSVPLRKQMWRNIVVHKIENQNKCLQLMGKDPVLLEYAKRVHSDDSSNMEAVAASKYFRTLFDAKFNRDQDNNINSALNYGYTILRGVVARSVVSHGLMPFLGLKHCSMLNNYNLADDLIEVFRPYVDLYVAQNFDVKFGRDYKIGLYSLLNKNCFIGESNYALSYAVEIFVQSFVESLEKEEDVLKFPVLTNLEDHEYE